MSRIAPLRVGSWPIQYAEAGTDKPARRSAEATQWRNATGLKRGRPHFLAKRSVRVRIDSAVWAVLISWPFQRRSQIRIGVLDETSKAAFFHASKASTTFGGS